jgi:hypothetical protein
MCERRACASCTLNTPAYRRLPSANVKALPFPLTLPIHPHPTQLCGDGQRREHRPPPEPSVPQPGCVDGARNTVSRSNSNGIAPECAPGRIGVEGVGLAHASPYPLMMPASQPQPGSIDHHPAPSKPVCRVVFDQRGAPRLSKQACPGEWRNGHTPCGQQTSPGGSRFSDQSTLPLPCMYSLSPLLINALAPPHQCARSCRSGPRLKAGPAAAYQHATASGLGRLQASSRARWCRRSGGWDAFLVQRLFWGEGGVNPAPGCYVASAMCLWPLFAFAATRLRPRTRVRCRVGMFGPGLCSVEPRACI